jgi:ligand-binding SRPBCC domain-containing protein
MVRSLKTAQVLPIGLDEAWRFFSDPRNLARITPAWLGFEVVSELPDKIYSGLIIQYRVRPVLRLPVSWVTEITHVAEPHRFVDEQRFGPYRFWHHQHHFREVDGGTEVLDWVHYAPPRGLPVAWLDRWLIAPRLREIFAYRSTVLEDRFGAPSAPRRGPA